MTSRPTIASAALVLVVGAALAGCTAAAPPTPRPTLTPLSPEQEAFAAAEATYRAYITALNGVDLADAETFEPVYQWLSGDALKGERESLERMRTKNWTVTGSSHIEMSSPEAFDGVNVSLTVCLNVSEIGLTDTAGVSHVSEERPDVFGLTVDLTPSAETATGMTISAMNANGDVTCEH